jgi:hypothetical protein
MTQSEELELKIYQYAEAAGKAQWRVANIAMVSAAGAFPEWPIIVDAFHDLHSRRFVELRRWQGDWIPYGGTDISFFQREFNVRVTFSGRKYFEALEAQPIRREQFSAAAEQIPPRLKPSQEHPRAFVSHSTQDSTFVKKLAADLRSNGVEAWYSGWEIKAGDSIRSKIDEGLECEHFIIVLSKSSMTRPWVQTELDAATVRRIEGKVKKIIPVKIEDCGDLPPTLGSLCWEDFSSQSYDVAFKRILDSIFDHDVRPPLGTLPTRGSKPPVHHQREGGLTTQFPISMNSVAAFVTLLGDEGFDARCDLFNGQVGVIVGPEGLDSSRMPPETQGLLFPLWELNQRANRALVVERRFHDMFERRTPDWQLHRPHPEVEAEVNSIRQSEFRLIGPHDVDLVLEIFHSPEGRRGVLARLHNRRVAGLSSCSVIVTDARSFDATRQSFRESAGFNRIEVLKEDCGAGFESRNAWLLRIEGNHIEVGAYVNQCIMLWPTGDKSDRERWRLYLKMTSKGLDEWTQEVECEWVRGSKAIRIVPLEGEQRQ